jgi:hypothetical protein
MDTTKISSSARPEPYESWLEFAIVSFDAKSAAPDYLFNNSYRAKTDEIKNSLWAEFNDLRARAGLLPWQPPLFQLTTLIPKTAPAVNDNDAQ